MTELKISQVPSKLLRGDYDLYKANIFFKRLCLKVSYLTQAWHEEGNHILVWKYITFGALQNKNHVPSTSNWSNCLMVNTNVEIGTHRIGFHPILLLTFWINSYSKSMPDSFPPLNHYILLTASLNTSPTTSFNYVTSPTPYSFLIYHVQLLHPNLFSLCMPFSELPSAKPPSPTDEYFNDTCRVFTISVIVKHEITDRSLFLM